MLGASSAHRWIKCALSTRFSGSGRPSSPDAVEGQAAHYVAAAVLTGDASQASDMVDRISPEGFCITADMAAHVQGYIDAVGRPPLIHVEHTCGTDAIGCRVDCAIDHGTSLEILDLKYGWKIHEPYYNPQLLIGAALLASPAHQSITLSIYQPRPFHPEGPYRKHIIGRDDLAYQWKYILDRAAATTHPTPPGTPGPHCEGCAGTAQCAALAVDVYGAYELMERGGFGTLSPDAMKHEFVFLTAMQDLVKARLNGVRAEIESRLRGGEYVPGMWLKPSYGHRVFTCPPDTIEAITGHSAVKSVSLTPADLEKEGVSASILNKVSTVPEVGRKVATITTKDIERLFNRTERH